MFRFTSRDWHLIVVLGGIALILFGWSRGHFGWIERERLRQAEYERRLRERETGIIEDGPFYPPQ